MCNFTYIECRSCTSKTACRLYTGDFSYCEGHLYGYPRSLDHFDETLMVEEKDEHGQLDDWADGIHLRTKPEKDSYLFGMIGCDKPCPVRDKDQRRECPYHMSGGIKERWDRMKMKGNMGAEKLIKERNKKREAGKRDEEKKLVKKSIKRQKGEAKVGNQSCCVVQ